MTRVKHYQVNKRKSDPEVAGHNWLAWAAAGYMVLVLVVTLLSDIIPNMSKWSILVVLPMVFLLYMVNSVRRQMDRIEQELAQERAQKHSARRSRSVRDRSEEQPTTGTFGRKRAELNGQRRLSKEQAMDDLLAFLADNPNASYSEAGHYIERSKSTVGNYLDELEDAGKVRRTDDGRVVVLSPNGREVTQ